MNVQFKYPDRADHTDVWTVHLRSGLAGSTWDIVLINGVQYPVLDTVIRKWLSDRGEALLEPGEKISYRQFARYARQLK